MKHNIIFLLFIFSIVILTQSCAKPDDEDGVSLPKYISEADFIPGTFIENFNSKTFTQEEAIMLMEAWFGPMTDADKLKLKMRSRTTQIESEAISYYTTVNNEKIVASGIVLSPIGVEPLGVIFAPQYFTNKNSECPSEALLVVQGILAFLGYNVVIPDNIGFGKTVDMVNPIVEKDIVGRYSVDMLFAAREFFYNKNTRFHKEIVVAGYSLGGALAIGFQRYADMHYSEKIPIKYTYAGGGAYYPLKSLDVMLEKQHNDYIGSIPMILIDINYWSNANLKFEDIFTDLVLNNFDKWFLEKNISMLEINSIIGSDIKNIIQEDVITNSENPEAKKIRNALKDYDLGDWQPKAPVKLYHATNDTYVPFENAKALYDYFKSVNANVTLKTSPKNHVDAALDMFVDLAYELE